MIGNIRASIVHSDCPCGYVLRSRSGTEKVKATSRRIFNPGKGKIVRTLFL